MKLPVFPRSLLSLMITMTIITGGIFANPKPSEPPANEKIPQNLAAILVIGAISLGVTLMVYDIITDDRIEFKSEEIEFNVNSDGYVHVKANYFFENHSRNTKIINITYPFPEANYLGEAEYLKIQKVSDSETDPINCQVQQNNWIFDLPFEAKTTTVLNIEYRQKTNENKFEYILTSARKWGNTLNSAVFRIKIPKGYTLDYCNYDPLLIELDDNYHVYQLSFDDFQPEYELEFNWIPQTAITEELIR